MIFHILNGYRNQLNSILHGLQLPNDSAAKVFGVWYSCVHPQHYSTNN